MSIGVEEPSHESEIIKLTDDAFGPGRYAKTAERIREMNSIIKELSFIASLNGELIASVRLWAIRILSDSGEVIDKIAFLGPVVVAGKARSIGLGHQLIKLAIETAKARSFNAIVLVGTQSYFGQLGFKKANRLNLGGPVDPERLLIYAFNEALAIEGRII